ncbi:MAG: 4-(cytidine 5'-diphospho)-2-C-methyl-D-erythritol kinase [Deltaproteobacteria bacterium]|nr:4-(cytidine 5'-diphospho)-2-C-methyl-D-erythritol kinase [Deltaproteobacteria bacterium]
MELVAPAKINLSLKVLGRQRDGYHQIESLFQPLDFGDKILLKRSSGGGLKLFCPNSDLPQDSANLAFRAAELFFEKTGITPGLEVTLDKNIPLAAGLGGGSSDAAAVLKGANHLFGRPFSKADLEKMGLSLGADVPFFIWARPAWARGVGHILSPASLPRFHYVLVNPGFQVSSAWAYAALRKPLTEAPAVDTIVPLFIESYQDLLPLANDLEPVVEKAWPIIAEVRQKLLASGAKLARMSGSGPTVFGLFEDDNQARTAARFLERHSLKMNRPWRIILTQGRS